MLSIYSRLKVEFPWLGLRSAAVPDFYEYCSRSNITVVYSNEISRGVYVLHDGKNYIFLNHNLAGVRLLRVAFHEIGHYLFHVPTQSQFAAEFFGVNHNKLKNEIEAEAVASMLLLPLIELEKAVASRLGETDNDLAEMMFMRLEVFNAIRL